MQHDNHRVFSSLIGRIKRADGDERIPSLQAILRRSLVRFFPAIAGFHLIFRPTHGILFPVKFLNHTTLRPIGNHLWSMVVKLIQDRFHHVGNCLDIAALFQGFQIHIGIEGCVQINHPINPLVVGHYKLLLKNFVVCHVRYAPFLKYAFIIQRNN